MSGDDLRGRGSLGRRATLKERHPRSYRLVGCCLGSDAKKPLVPVRPTREALTWGQAGLSPQSSERRVALSLPTEPAFTHA